jgi:hypothetical protein
MLGEVLDGLYRFEVRCTSLDNQISLITAHFRLLGDIHLDLLMCFLPEHRAVIKVNVALDSEGLFLWPLESPRSAPPRSPSRHAGLTSTR